MYMSMVRRSGSCLSEVWRLWWLESSRLGLVLLKHKSQGGPPALHQMVALLNSMHYIQELMAYFTTTMYPTYGMIACSQRLSTSFQSLDSCRWKEAPEALPLLMPRNFPRVIPPSEHIKTRNAQWRLYWNEPWPLLPSHSQK